MWKLVLYRKGIEAEHLSLCVEYLKSFLTKARYRGYEGFIFRD